MSTKHILFIGHSNNDVDHYFPLIKKITAKGSAKPILFCLPSESVLIQNKLHKYLIDLFSVQTFSASNLFYNTGGTKLIFFTYSFLDSLYNSFTSKSLKANLPVARSALVFFRKTVGLFKSIFHNILVDLIKERKCFNKLKRFFDSNNIICVVYDSSKILLEGGEKELILKMRGIVTRFAHNNKIPLYMLSHGVSVKYDPGKARKIQENKFISPNVIATCNEQEIDQSKYDKTNSKVIACGDLRYDIGWIAFLEESVKKIPEFSLKKEGKIALYVVANFNWLNNKELQNSIHRDVFNLLNKFEDLTLWVKLHPRYPLDFPIRDFNSSRFKLFSNEIDSTALLLHADIIISPLSGLLLHPMLNKKRVVFYDKVRAETKGDWKALFDDTNCLDKATNPKELEESCKKILDGHNYSFDDLEVFYKNSISGGVGLDQSIIDKHYGLLSSLYQDNDN